MNKSNPPITVCIPELRGKFSIHDLFGDFPAVSGRSQCGDLYIIASIRGGNNRAVNVGAGRRAVVFIVKPVPGIQRPLAGGRRDPGVSGIVICLLQIRAHSGVLYHQVREGNDPGHILVNFVSDKMKIRNGRLPLGESEIFYGNKSGRNDDNQSGGKGK